MYSLEVAILREKMNMISFAPLICDVTESNRQPEIGNTGIPWAMLYVLEIVAWQTALHHVTPQ